MSSYFAATSSLLVGECAHVDLSESLHWQSWHGEEDLQSFGFDRASSERTVVIIPKGEAFANGRDILTSYVGERKTSWWIVTGPILSEEKQCARLDQFHLPFENISEGWHPNVASFTHSGKINLGVVRGNFKWGYFCTKWMMKKLGLEKNSKEIDVKMVKKPPSVDNPTIIKLYFFNGITWKGIANQPAAFV